MPIEIGLRGIVEVKIVVARFSERRPGGASELGNPIGGERTVRLRWTNVIVVLVFLLPRQGSLEPFVIGGRMVEDHVQHHADAVRLQSGDEFVEVLHSSHRRIDGAVVGYVVAVVPLR